MTSVQRDVLYVNPPYNCDLVSQFKDAGWEVCTARSPLEVERQLRSRTFHVGLMRLTGRDGGGGSGFLRDCLNLRNTEWIALLPRDVVNIPEIRRLIASHFHDFHTLPVKSVRILESLGHAYGMASLKRQELGEEVTIEAEMVGGSPVMLELFRAVRKVADVDAPVLVTGESGTGKELTARAIHERSTRAAGPFVAINCGALPPNLIQSELFGYERGAFTGASQRKLGRIEMANGGTLFLDEIGDLPLDLQANLLRFLQEGQVDRIGGQGPVAVDVRVVAATHVNLEKAIEERRFREDLYHRLSVLCLHIPPLRERGDDIEVVARYFFSQFAKDGRRSLRDFSKEALDAIRRHSWPGNVRELINRVRRAVVMSEGRLLTPHDLGLATDAQRQPTWPQTLEEVREAVELQALKMAVCRHPNNLSRMARDLGISRVTLYRLLEKHGLRQSQNDEAACGRELN